MSGLFKQFEEIDAWKEGSRLTIEVYAITRGKLFMKDFGLRDQIRRAAVSIPSNIAEGFERDSPGDFIRFLRIAKGSAGELRTQLYIAHRLGYLEQEDFQRLIKQAKHVASMISRLVQHLEKREHL